MRFRIAKRGSPLVQEQSADVHDRGRLASAPDGGPLWSSREEAYASGFRPRKIPRSRRRYDPNCPKLRGPQIQAEHDLARAEREAEQARRQGQYQAERAVALEPTPEPRESSWWDVLGDF